MEKNVTVDFDFNSLAISTQTNCESVYKRTDAPLDEV
jgi:hypothetical protein